jgi:hypothetical protein
MEKGREISSAEQLLAEEGVKRMHRILMSLPSAKWSRLTFFGEALCYSVDT